MVRRRRSTNKGKEVTDSIRSARSLVAGDVDEAKSTRFESDSQNTFTPRILTASGKQAQATASGIPSGRENKDDREKAHRRAPARSVKVAPGRFTNGFGLKSFGAGANPKRSDSVDLTQAENGAFLSAIDGEQSQSSTLATAPTKRTASTMSVMVRAFKGRKGLLLLLLLAVVAIAVLGPSERRKQVVSQAQSALNEGLESADDYWDKAGGFLNDMRKKPPSELQPSLNIKPKPDSDPHKIDLPPMSDRPASAVSTSEASILDSVRKMPALHADSQSTTQCTSNNNAILDIHKTPRPTVQYAIMIDAGSTGSRVHVYRFNFCKESPELEHDTFKMIKGGLSSYKADSRGAAKSLEPLLDVAMQTVPENLRSCTPISVKATAGLRLLGADMSKNILQAVRDMLQNEYPFPIADGAGRNGVEIMEGRDEGVFAWITVNYLLNRIGVEQSSASDAIKTAAVMDLGGASTQIVFEPIYPSSTQGMHPGEHVYELNNFGGKQYKLYQNSYLGYGLMEARKSINSLSYLSYFLAHPGMVRQGKMPHGAAVGTGDAAQGAVRVPSPCFAKGSTKEVGVRVPGQEDGVNVTMFGTSGGFEACKRLVEVTMDKDAICTQAPCSFAGVYQPSLMTAFAHSPIVALSYFYDRLTPLGLNGTFPLKSLTDLAHKVCSPPDQWTKHFGAKGSSEAADKAWSELQDRPETCLDLTFLDALLRLGYELDDTRSVTVAKQLADVELGWCLGAQLQVLQDGVICRAH